MMNKTDKQLIKELDKEHALLDILSGYLEGYDTEDIFDGICDDCSDDDDEGCHSCDGMDVITEIHRSIQEEGIIFIRQLIRDWKADSVGVTSDEK